MIRLLLLAFVLFFVITSPTGAADLVGTVAGLFARLFEGIGTMLAVLL